MITCNAFFAGSEIAVVSVRKSRLTQLIDEGRRGARTALFLKEHPERFLATVQVGITVVGATAAAFGGASIAARIAPAIASVSWLAPHAQQIALAAVIAIVSYLSIVIGELVPKSLALRSSERIALIAARPLAALAWLARPLVAFLTASSNLLLRPFGDRTTFTETRLSAEELRQLVEEASAAGNLHPHAAEIASRAIEFQDLIAEEVMVPRQEVVMLRRHASPDEVRRVLLEHTHNRMPVYEDKPDNIVGYISVKDLLAVAFEHKLIVLEDVMRPPYFVPETRRAVDLLQDMRKRRVPFAIVVDEQGGMSGIVTLEDLLEELVGEIFTEHAKSAPDLIRKEADGSAVVSGATPIREINRALGLDLSEEGPWTTVAGLCTAVAGRIPAPGERVALDNGVVLEVLEATPRRVRSLRVHPPAPEPEKR